MSNTKIILDKSFFTLEITEKFINDLDLACKTMEEDLFVNLFINSPYAKKHISNSIMQL